MAAWNRQLNPSGIKVSLLRCRSQSKCQRSLIYVYRPAELQRSLEAPWAARLLKRFGYRSTKIDSALSTLCQRFAAEGDFPHEIGLFLGYPIEDVEGFILHGGKNCKYAGCWKVYGDVEKAQKIFASYKQCRRRLMNDWSHGASLTNLAVAL